jgi:diguanylate cyclase (GGDEF)-like protein/PAS domain S-box-containing protein
MRAKLHPVIKKVMLALLAGIYAAFCIAWGLILQSQDADSLTPMMQILIWISVIALIAIICISAVLSIVLQKQTLNNQFNQQLLENQTEGVITCDSNLQLLTFNRTARDWHGLDPLKIRAEEWSNYYDLYDADGRQRLNVEQIPLVRAFNGETIKDVQMVVKAKGQAPRIVCCNGNAFYDDAANKLGAIIVMRDITTELEQSKILLQNEAIYREMFDANPIPMWVFNIKTLDFLAVNNAAVDLYGWTKEEFLAMTLMDMRPVEEQQKLLQLQPSFENNQVKSFGEWLHWKKDGSLIDVEITSHPIIFNGQTARLVQAYDVTERKLIEFETQCTNRLLLMLSNVNKLIMHRLPLLEIFHEACRIAVDDGGFRMAWIGLIDEHANKVNVISSAGETGSYIENLNIDLRNSETHQIRIADLKNGPIVTSIKSAKYVVIDDIATDKRMTYWREAALGHGYKSMMSLPLNTNGKVIGTLNVYVGQTNLFKQRVIDLLDQFSNDVSFAISASDVDREKQLAEQALQKSQTLFHTLAQSSPVGIFHTNAKGQFIYVNKSWVKITETKLEQAANNRWLNALYEEDRPKVSAKWKEALATKQAFNQEFRFIRTDGKTVWVKGQAATEYDEQHQFMGFVGTITDITILKNNEEQHRMSRAVFENTREGIMVTDADSRILMVNSAFTDITGYDSEEVINLSPKLLNSGRHDESFFSDLWDILIQTGHWQGEMWNRRKNGEVYPQLMSISSIKSELGDTTNYVAVFADISNIKASEDQLEFLANHDPLTHLPNRLMLLSRLDHAVQVARREGNMLALLMLDLDRFKNVNDSFGHLAGDELLQQVAKRLLSKLRAVDTVTRLGGDEFTILIEGISSQEDVNKIASSIISALETPWTLSNNVEVRIGTSIGVSMFPGHGESALELLQHADAALYQAKNAGRGCIRYFSESLTQAARDRFHIESRLRQAIPNNELRVYYQPKVDIRTGRIIGAEALVRWQDPVDGLIMPFIFIGIAEETGLIKSLGEWVLAETCRQGREWMDAGMLPLNLAVNLSAHQFHHGNIVKTLSDVLESSGFPAERLELELTESILMQRENEMVETLNQLRSKGVSLSIDDFGTGYSSLAYLKTFPLDVLKIDRSFVMDIEKDEDDRAITATIIKIAHTLGLRVVAEGVETQEQLEFLDAHGCDMYQGYLMGKPMPADDFIALLKRTNH